MRRKISKQLLALAAALCLMVCMMPASVKANGPDPVKYVALGDSITRGYGLDNPETESFPALLADDKGYSVVNYGKDGATSATLLASLSNSEVVADVTSADVISITVGGNDLMEALYTYVANEWYNSKGESITAEMVKKRLEAADLDMLRFALNEIDNFAGAPVAKQAVADIVKNLESVIVTVRKLNPDVVLFVATQYNPYKWLPAQCKDEIYRSQVEKIAAVFDAGVSYLNQMIIGTAGSKTYTAVDVYGAFNNSDDDLSNAKYTLTYIGGIPFPSINLDFHPNAAGHQKIASVIGDKIIDVVSGTFDSIANSVLSLSNTIVAQADVTSEEQAKAWAESQLKSVIPAGVSSEVVVSDFVAATEGTAQNKTGTNGSFNVAVTLDWLGTSTKPITAKVPIQATAYTEPAVNPGSGDDEITDADKQAQTSQVNTAVNKNKSSVPKTGDTAEPLQYMVLVLAAGIVAVTILRRISIR